MKYVGNKVPVTGAMPEYGKGRRPLLPNAADTSRDAQNNIRKAPMPFGNDESTAYIPAPTNEYNRADAQRFERDGLRFGGVPKPVGVRNTRVTNYGATGDRRPNGYNPVNSGFPSGGNRVAGRISTNAGPEASAKEQRAMRSMAKLGMAKAYQDFKKYGG